MEKRFKNVKLVDWVQVLFGSPPDVKKIAISDKFGRNVIIKQNGEKIAVIHDKSYTKSIK